MPALLPLSLLVASAFPELEAAHFDFRVRAMSVLLAWSALNILAGGAGAVLGRTKGARVFLGANGAWNLVNLAIALGGLLSALGHAPGSLEGIPLVREMVFFRDVLLVNVGLDVGYVGAGVVTWLWGRSLQEPWRIGIGLALVVQGLFLFGFDVILSFIVSGHLAEGWGLVS
jgi:hypothetical protein